MVKCKYCKRTAKFRGKSLCFVHLHNKVHVEADMPYQINPGDFFVGGIPQEVISPIGETVSKSKRGRKKKEPIEQVANV